jgi:hypothetical protein
MGFSMIGGLAGELEDGTTYSACTRRRAVSRCCSGRSPSSRYAVADLSQQLRHGRGRLRPWVSHQSCAGRRIHGYRVVRRMTLFRRASSAWDRPCRCTRAAGSGYRVCARRVAVHPPLSALVRLDRAPLGRADDLVVVDREPAGGRGIFGPTSVEVALSGTEIVGASSPSPQAAAAASRSKWSISSSWTVQSSWTASQPPGNRKAPPPCQREAACQAARRPPPATPMSCSRSRRRQARRVIGARVDRLPSTR